MKLLRGFTPVNDTSLSTTTVVTGAIFFEPGLLLRLLGLGLALLPFLGEFLVGDASIGSALVGLLVGVASIGSAGSWDQGAPSKR
jgi:hypothetical protein